LRLLRAHGRNATSFQVMEPGLAYWFDGATPADARACVAYARTRTAWVAAGAPIATPDEVWRVGERFVAAARAAGKRATFVCVERWAAEVPWLAHLAIGAQPVWQPAAWPEALARSRSLREQLRRARAKGVAVRVVPAVEMADRASAVRRGSDALIERWLASRKLAALGFLVALHPYELPSERRYLVAERDGEVVGFLAAVPVYLRRGWLLEDFLRAPEAPNGTMELLFAAALAALAAEGAGHVTMGLAPLAGSTGVLGAIRDHTRWLYDFEGLRAFKAKLRPSAWEPVYLAWPRRRAGLLAALLDCLRAFARGSLRRFAVATLAHRRRAVLAILAALLVPWTLLLALAAPRWFPGVAIQRAWIGFDVAMLALLGGLLVRWRPRLAALAAGLATADAGLTALQALRWNLPRLRGPLDLVVVGLSVAAPAFAAWLLWRSRD
jgi:phosphatidylglycerol lysyltransferase